MFRRKKLAVVFRIALEWPDEIFDNIFEEAIPLRKMELSTVSIC